MIRGLIQLATYLGEGLFLVGIVVFSFFGATALLATFGP
jgi:hypothetical protein